MHGPFSKILRGWVPGPKIDAPACRPIVVKKTPKKTPHSLPGVACYADGRPNRGIVPLRHLRHVTPPDSTAEDCGKWFTESSTIRYDTIEEINVDSKAEYTA